MNCFDDAVMVPFGKMMPIDKCRNDKCTLRINSLHRGDTTISIKQKLYRMGCFGVRNHEILGHFLIDLDINGPIRKRALVHLVRLGCVLMSLWVVIEISGCRKEENLPHSK